MHLTLCEPKSPAYPSSAAAVCVEAVIRPLQVHADLTGISRLLSYLETFTNLIEPLTLVLDHIGMFFMLTMQVLAELGESAFIEERIARAYGSAPNLITTQGEGEEEEEEKAAILAHVRCERISLLFHESTPYDWPRAGAETIAESALIEATIDEVNLRAALTAVDEEAPSDELPEFDLRLTLRSIDAVGFRLDRGGEQRVPLLRTLAPGGLAPTGEEVEGEDAPGDHEGDVGDAATQAANGESDGYARKWRADVTDDILREYASHGMLDVAEARRGKPMLSSHLSLPSEAALHRQLIVARSRTLSPARGGKSGSESGSESGSGDGDAISVALYLLPLQLIVEPTTFGAVANAVALADAVVNATSEQIASARQRAARRRSMETATSSGDQTVLLYFGASQAQLEGGGGLCGAGGGGVGGARDTVVAVFGAAPSSGHRCATRLQPKHQRDHPAMRHPSRQQRSHRAR